MILNGFCIHSESFDNNIIKYIMVLIRIIRHSERLDFANPFVWLFYFGHYWADSPLTINGHKNADLKGKELISNTFNPKYIYTSPYNRTLETSIEIKKSFPMAEIVIEPLLSEYQGYYQHKISLYPEGIPTTYEGMDTEFSYPESYEDFSKRVQFIIQKLIEKKMDLIVVTHGELLRSLINYLQNIYSSIEIDPGMTPYLTVLSFEYDIESGQIIESSIKLD